MKGSPLSKGPTHNSDASISFGGDHNGPDMGRERSSGFKKVDICCL